jgi:hypothetical protein
MWKTIDRFSQGKGEATDDTGEEADAIDDPGDEGGKGAHVKDDE